LAEIVEIDAVCLALGGLAQLPMVITCPVDKARSGAELVELTKRIGSELAFIENGKLHYVPDAFHFLREDQDFSITVQRDS